MENKLKPEIRGEGITDEQLEKVAKEKYPLLSYKADAHNDVRENANKIIKQQQQSFVDGAQYILSHSVDRGREAVAFCEWCENNYWRIKSKELNKSEWVSIDEEILVHGSDFYYTNLIKEKGKTTEQLYEIYKKS